MISVAFTACTSLPIFQPTDKPVSQPSEEKQAHTGGGSTHTTATSRVKIEPIWNQQHAINSKLIAFNTGYMFTAPIEKEKAVEKITQTLQPYALRFPGGTIGNYYHPDGIGYGFKEEEVQHKMPEITKAMPLFNQNAIHHFVDLCKMSNTNAIYVANMMTAPVEETIWAVEHLLKNNIPVVAIELGNEFYLEQYRDYFPTPESYVKKAKEFAQVLRKKFPQIPLGAVAASPTESNPKGNYGKYKQLWNITLGKENFYDFYIPHLYPKVQACADFGGGDKAKVFECLNLSLGIEHLDYFQIIVDYYRPYFGDKKMWITEWNSQAEGQISNTVRHASFVAEYLMGLIDYSEKYPQIEQAYFHNYGSGGYVSPIFTYSNKASSLYYKKEGHIAYNASYFPFLYVRQLINQNAQRTAEQITYPKDLGKDKIVFKSFVNADKRKLYLFFINKSTQYIPFEVAGAQQIIQTQGIQGKYPWSVAGYNGIYRADGKHDLIQEIPQHYKDYIVPANSVGYFEIAL